MTAEIGAEDLGIDVTRGEAELFKWFVASFLFGKRIQRDIAAEAYRVLVERNRLDTPRKLRDCGQLLKLGDQLLTEYDGRLGRLRELGETRDGVEKRLLAFEGVGPKTVEIFLREAARVWF